MEKEKYKCQSCGAEFDRCIEVLVTLAQAHNPKPMECQLCGGEIILVKKQKRKAVKKG